MDFLRTFSGVVDRSRLIGGEDLSVYEPCTTGAVRTIVGAIRTVSAEEIQKIIEISRRHKVKLYPLSAGRNWGYSDSMPATDDNVIVDLSLMKDIRNYDPEMGTITVEPGVTQQQLADFLMAHGGRHIISVTGSSPEASIIGNYLERGFGLLPIMDHAYSVLSLEALTGAGEIYRSPLLSCGADKSASLFRWGVGPYTDGLFFQSSWGIVTQMTIRLSKRAQDTQVCFIELASPLMLDRALPLLRDLREDWPLESLQIKILNGYYTLTSMGIKHKACANHDLYQKLLEENRLPPYTIMISFSGAHSLTKSMARHVRRKFPFSSKTTVLNRHLIALTRMVSGFVPAQLKTKIRSAEDLWSLMQGKPSKAMIGKIPYFRMDDTVGLSLENPAHDGCGIIWFAISLPLASQGISFFENLGAYAHKNFGFSPIINFTNYQHSSCIGLLAIVYNKDTEVEAAQRCYFDLMNQAQAEGYFPYRLPLFAAQKFFSDNPLALNRHFEKILDPDQVFSRQC